MEILKYTIYKLIDPITNETRYIGLTFDILKQRLKSHCYEKSSSHKSNWVKILKSEGLKPIIEEVETGEATLEECDKIETFYIDKFKSEGHKLTNMSTGGGKNKKMSEETKKRMSESQLERYKNYTLVISEETKKHLSEQSKKRFENDIEREKLRISNKKFEDSKTPEQKLNDVIIQNPKKVYQYDKNMNFITEYPSIKSVERITGLSSSNITKCCKNKIRYVGGCVWRFEGDLNPPQYKNRKSVEQYDLNMNLISEYENIRKASIYTGISDTSIRLCCKEVRDRAGGFIWKYKS